jgi:hypothetical protein
MSNFKAKMLLAFLTISLFCFQLSSGDKLLVCQVSGDTCTFTSKFLENNERAIIVADHTEPGSSNADIKKVNFVSSSIYQIPAELFVTFPNLEELVMDGKAKFAGNQAKYFHQCQEFEAFEIKL